ncbi:hypothetical protein HanPI659440_Chr04g0148641 [Helianthus annuus]|nr:hypothetical protein HanPI659440_Chr04g0148641 [Helianthus annuus]
MYENAVKSEIKRLKEDSDVMKNAKGDICSKIVERQRKIALLENDSSTLSQVHVTCCESRDDAYMNMVKKIDAAKAKFDNLTQMRSELASESHKVKQSLEELKCRMDSYEPKLRDMPNEALEEEVRALMSDKSGETEYQESMQSQIDTIKVNMLLNFGRFADYTLNK